jgi:hypothetical protein
VRPESKTEIKSLFGWVLKINCLSAAVVPIQQLTKWEAKALASTRKPRNSGNGERLSPWNVTIPSFEHFQQYSTSSRESLHDSDTHLEDQITIYLLHLACLSNGCEHVQYMSCIVKPLPDTRLISHRRSSRQPGVRYWLLLSAFLSTKSCLDAFGPAGSSMFGRLGKFRERRSSLQFLSD